MVLPDARSFRFHSFDPGYIGLVLNLMLPLYRDTIRYTQESCTVPQHTAVVSVVMAVISEVRIAVTAVKESDPGLHLGVQPVS